MSVIILLLWWGSSWKRWIWSCKKLRLPWNAGLVRSVFYESVDDIKFWWWYSLFYFDISMCYFYFLSLTRLVSETETLSIHFEVWDHMVKAYLHRWKIESTWVPLCYQAISLSAHSTCSKVTSHTLPSRNLDPPTPNASHEWDGWNCKIELYW